MTHQRVVVLVHGAWVTSQSWDPFQAQLEAAGYRVRVPTWPGLDGRLAGDLNRSLPTGFGALTLGAIVEHYASILAGYAEQPLLVGHSFGGLLVQKLLDLGFGSAGVAINPAPIAGIVPGKTTLGSIWPALARWDGWSRPYAHSRDSFRRLYANTAPDDLVSRFYDDTVIPAPGRIFFQAASWIGTGINAGRRHQPLLITGSSEDRLVSPYLSRAAWRLQRRSHAATDYLHFEGLSHLLIAEPGYDTVAKGVIDWLGAQGLRETHVSDRSLRAAGARRLG